MVEQMQDRIERIKNSVSKATNNQARIEGQLEGIMTSFKKLSCESIEDADNLHKSTAKLLKKKVKKFSSDMDKWEKDYDNLL